MYYVIVTMAMLFGNSPGRIVITEMDTSAALPPINQAAVPLGARASYMKRGQLEGILVIMRCGGPTRTDAVSATYECLGVQQ